jgi:hypothetical protein
MADCIHLIHHAPTNPGKTRYELEAAMPPLWVVYEQSFIGHGLPDHHRPYTEGDHAQFMAFLPTFANEWGHIPRDCKLLMLNVEAHELASTDAVAWWGPALTWLSDNRPGIKVGFYNAAEHVNDHPAYHPDRLHLHTDLADLCGCAFPNRYPNDLYTTSDYPRFSWQKTQTEFETLCRQECDYHAQSAHGKPMILVASWQQWWDSGGGPASWGAVVAQWKAAVAYCDSIAWWVHMASPRQQQHGVDFMARIEAQRASGGVSAARKREAVGFGEA